eukprot:41113-Pyramimonas_sp.AAC.1
MDRAASPMHRRRIGDALATQRRRVDIGGALATPTWRMKGRLHIELHRRCVGDAARSSIYSDPI